MSDPIYKVKDWNLHYENSRSRSVENLRWVSLPNKHDGEGYSMVMEQENAAELFAAWVLIVQVASKCHERGTLTRDDGTPLTAKALSRKTKAPEAWFQMAFKFFTESALWLERDEQPSLACHLPATQPSPTYHLSADVRGVDGMGVNGREELTPTSPQRGNGGDELPFDDVGEKPQDVAANAKKRKPREPSEPIALPFDSPEFVKTVEDFRKYRRQLKKPLTEIGESRLMAQLAKLGEKKAIEKMDEAMARGWQGVVFNETETTPKKGFTPAHHTEIMGMKRSELIDDMEKRLGIPIT